MYTIFNMYLVLQDNAENRELQKNLFAKAELLSKSKKNKKKKKPGGPENLALESQVSCVFH